MTAPGKPLDLDGMEKMAREAVEQRAAWIDRGFTFEPATAGSYDATFDPPTVLALIQTQRELVGALKPFAALADVYAPQEDDAHPVWKDWDVLDRRFAEFTVGAARKARAAYTKALGEQPL